MGFKKVFYKFPGRNNYSSKRSGNFKIVGAARVATEKSLAAMLDCDVWNWRNNQTTSSQVPESDEPLHTLGCPTSFPLAVSRTWTIVQNSHIWSNNGACSRSNSNANRVGHHQRIVRLSGVERLSATTASSSRPTLPFIVNISVTMYIFSPYLSAFYPNPFCLSLSHSRLLILSYQFSTILSPNWNL